jgi:hypothetical protein
VVGWVEHSEPIIGRFRVEAGQELVGGWRHGLASFETRPLGAPQDEYQTLMALRKFLTRGDREGGRLEGRTAPVQPIGISCPASLLNPR